MIVKLGKMTVAIAAILCLTLLLDHSVVVFLQ